jgi:hypothetical protein
MRLYLHLCLILIIINFASAASLPGHRYRHFHEASSDARSNSTTHPNGTPFSLNSVAEERAKVQQHQRNARSIPDGPRDLGTKEGESSEYEDDKIMAAWMQYTIAVLAMGLVLGAELVG